MLRNSTASALAVSLATAILSAFSIQAAASGPNFFCDGGEITINVTLPDEGEELARIDFEGEDPVELEPVDADGEARFEGGGYVLTRGDDRMTLELLDGQLTECVSAETLARQRGAAAAVTNLPAPGFSYGGKVREGPGTNHPQVGSLQQKEPVTLLEDTGIDLNGYSWFKIEFGDGQTGYQWGGILCSPRQIEGLFNPCSM